MKKIKKLIKKVHFTISADWATDFVRERWSEGEYLWCYEFLLGCGIKDIPVARMIINGKKRMAETGEPNTFTLADDNWKPNLDNCHLGLYPNPDHYSEMSAATEALSKNRIDKERSNIISEYEDARAEASFNRFKHRSNNDDDGYKGLARIEGNKVVQQFLDGQLLNDEIAKAEKMPEPSDVYEHGIITPDGKFYRCGVMGHNVLAVSLGYSDELEYDRDDLDPSTKALHKGCIIVSLTLAEKRIRTPPESLNIGVTAKQREALKKWVNLVSYSKVPLNRMDY